MACDSSLQAEECQTPFRPSFYHATLEDRMAEETDMSPTAPQNQQESLWCPACRRAVNDPLVCGDCATVICRVCGTPLESPDELAFG